MLGVSLSVCMLFRDLAAAWYIWHSWQQLKCPVLLVLIHMSDRIGGNRYSWITPTTLFLCFICISDS